MQKEAKEESSSHNPAPGSAHVSEVPLDTRLLSEAVIELNISRKNVAIYPPGHVQIARSLDRAYEILTSMLTVCSEMTLGVAKDTLLVGHDYLDRKNPVYRDFALSLNQQAIAAVTFERGLEKQELERFHRILTTKPEEIRAQGGIEKTAADAAIPHIRIKSIDYAGLHLTEESEITKPSIKTDGHSNDLIWQDFVSHLSAGTLARAGEKGLLIGDAGEIDPAELAKLLNERKLDAKPALESYASIISSHMRESDRSSLSSGQTETLKKLNEVLRELHPEIRKQFLNVAVSLTSNLKIEPEKMSQIAGGFTDDMVVEMLELASSEGREISPTLAALVARLSRIQSAAPGDEKNAVSSEHMKKLFDRESYEQYVGSEYDATLKRLSQEIGKDAGGIDGFPLAEHEQSLQDTRLDMQIGRALIAFMEEDIDPEDYGEFSSKIAALAPDFLDTGNFELLFEIFETVRRHSAAKPHPEIREKAEQTRKLFTDPEFIKRALIAFERLLKDKGQEAVVLIQALGPDVVPGLFDILMRDETFAGKRMIFNMLGLFGDTALREAYKRLRDPRSHYILTILMFLKRAGTSGSIAPVKQLIRHEDPSVRMEALSALLKLKDPGAPNVLREWLRSTDPDIASYAVVLAGQYRVPGLTAEILARLKKVILFDTDYIVNEEIIKALGEIGDSRAIPDLEKLARASWTMHPQGLARMKNALFASLTRYPPDSISGLLKIGERSADENIKRACKKLRERA